MGKSILIIGGGGREHTIGWKLIQSARVSKLYFAPGNAGTATIGENIPIDPANVTGLIHVARKHQIDVTVVGTEAALAAGIVDRFAKEGLAVFGPTQAAARLETSKVWATQFMKRHGLPCPVSETFHDIQKAIAYAEQLKGNCVVKADGLCQGKGVFVCSSPDEAKKALWAIMVEKVFGEAGRRVVIQEKLAGREVSVMAFCDGNRAIPLVPASDYKRIFDGNRGLNTGGMGSIAPANLNKKVLKKIHTLLRQTITSMKKEGLPYRGVLYGGIMLVGDKPYILEYNCRFGDPETQAQLPLLASDLFSIIAAAARGKLTPSMVRWKKKHAVCVVAAARGYPGAFSNGKVISGFEKVTKDKDTVVFHAGTIADNGTIKTNGGRVLGVVAIADSRPTARRKAYAGIQKISFSGMQYRKDIAK